MKKISKIFLKKYNFIVDIFLIFGIINIAVDKWTRSSVGRATDS